jgi:hypothetical protein
MQSIKKFFLLKESSVAYPVSPLLNIPLWCIMLLYSHIRPWSDRNVWSEHSFPYFFVVDFKNWYWNTPCEISDFRRGVNEKLSLLRCYLACVGSCPGFRDSLSVRYSWLKQSKPLNMGPIDCPCPCPEVLLNNYKHTNITEEWRLPNTAS